MKTESVEPHSQNDPSEGKKSLPEKVLAKIKHYTTGEWYYLGDLVWFAGLLLVFHFSYHSVADSLLALPWVQSIRLGLAVHISEVSFLLCSWAGLDTEVLSNRTIYFANGRGLTVVEGCSGFKQLLQSAFLLILFPGNWRHKLWFVPGALLIVHAANVFRIALLAAWSGLNWPFWQWMHDYPFRALYFLVIFALWYAWNENRVRVQQPIGLVRSTAPTGQLN